jgi:peptide/nickel transport system permease protein
MAVTTPDRFSGPVWQVNNFVRTFPLLTAGLIMLLVLLLFMVVGRILVDETGTLVGYAPPDQSPGSEYLLGTNTMGQEMLAIMVYGTPLTLQIGLIAGIIGLVVGTIMGFVAGFYGGFWDSLFRGAADVALTIPGFLILVVIASTLRGATDVMTQALIVSALAWMFPTRTIRSQVLSMRERGYIQIARRSGMSNLEIIGREMVPNLLPYLGASFVLAVITAILASIGLEALGLGPQNEPTMGMTIYWSMFYTAIIRDLWWWWLPPIVIITYIFMALYIVSSGLDQFANPRLRRRI